VDDVLRQEVATVTSAEHKGVNVDLDLASGSRVKGPVEEFRQVVINVFENAVHAVDPAGRVRIATRTHTGRVRITVEDDGDGIPAAELERVFDPFYTTRDPGEGMGLGLALSKRTLEDMGGTIQMRSREGRGTMVTIEVPTSDSQEVARSA